MKRIVFPLALLLLILVIIFIVVPFVVGAVIDQSCPSYFLSIISGIFLISGGWQLFKGKVRSGISLLLLSVIVFLLSRQVFFIF